MRELSTDSKHLEGNASDIYHREIATVSVVKDRSFNFHCCVGGLGNCIKEQMKLK